jgi:hypothetical protein
MSDSATERMVEVQKRLRIRLAELGFDGVAANNVVHRLAEISVLAKDLADHAVPLLVELAAEHHESITGVLFLIKRDMDEIRDAITDIEPDFTALLQSMERKAKETGS